MLEHACWMVLTLFRSWLRLDKSCHYLFSVRSMSATNKWRSPSWLFSQVIRQPQQLSDPIKTLHPITSLLWYGGMSLGGWTGLMIQRWSHPCWPSGTSDNDEAVLTLTADLLSHVQPIKTWKYKHLSYLNAAIQCGSSSHGTCLAMDFKLSKYIFQQGLLLIYGIEMN